MPETIHESHENGKNAVPSEDQINKLAMQLLIEQSQRRALLNSTLPNVTEEKQSEGNSQNGKPLYETSEREFSLSRRERTLMLTGGVLNIGRYGPKWLGPTVLAGSAAARIAFEYIPGSKPKR